MRSPSDPNVSPVGAEAPGLGAENRLATLGEVREPAAAALLALAFRDNPINRAVIGSDRGHRLRVNRHGMVASLVASRQFSFRRVALADPGGARGVPAGQVSGALIALDPGGYPVAPPSLTVQMRCLWGQGLSVMRRWSRLYRVLDACHPKQPHCYLALVATHPEQQRRGIGRALLNAWLRDVDARAMPSYLETDRRELVGFYRAAGFRVERELSPFDTPVWCMSRPAM